MHRALLVGIAAGAVASAPVAPVPPLVFSSTGSPDLVAPHWYTIKLDGRGRRALAFPPGELSPNGRFVARVAGSEQTPTIEVVAAGGAARTVVPRFPGSSSVEVRGIVWSPGSRRLALAVARGCGGATGKAITCSAYEIWSVRLDGRGLVRVALGRQPAWSADSRQLAFVRYYPPFARDSIFVVGAEGGTASALVPGVAPVWEPRGSRIAYQAPRGVAVVDTRDRRSKRVLRPGGTPVWSPDGRRLAYLRYPAAGPALLRLEVVDLRTRAVRLLAKAKPVTTIEAPAWSPDGRRIAYAGGRYGANTQLYVVASTGGPAKAVTHEPPWASFDAVRWTPGGGLVYRATQVLAPAHLYAVQPDGSGLVQLTHERFVDLDPSWSPDGTRIVFQRKSTDTRYPSLRQPGLYVLDAVSRVARRIVPIPSNAWPADPAWSPAGGEIAYTTSQRVVIVSTDGSPVASFRTGDNQPSHATWSPDGSRLALSLGGSISNQIFVVDRNGGGLRQLTHFSIATDPSWSPDGAWIAFVGRRDFEPYAYWIVAPDGSGLRKVADAAANGTTPAWSPDSTGLLCLQPTASGSALRAVRIDGSGADRTLVPSSKVTGIEGPTWRPRPATPP